MNYFLKKGKINLNLFLLPKFLNQQKQFLEKYYHKYKKSLGFNDKDTPKKFTPIINDINNPFL